MMKIGSANYLDLVERRLQLLREIFSLGAEWRTAFIGLKMEESERCAIEENSCANRFEISTIRLRPSVPLHPPIPSPAPESPLF